jgi:hypothetical protein
MFECLGEKSNSNFRVERLLFLSLICGHKKFIVGRVKFTVGQEAGNRLFFWTNREEFLSFHTCYKKRHQFLSSHLIRSDHLVTSLILGVEVNFDPKNIGYTAEI